MMGEDIERRKDFEDRSYNVFKRWEHGMTLAGAVLAIGGSFFLDDAIESFNSIMGIDTEIENVGMDLDWQNPVFWASLLLIGGAGAVGGKMAGRGIAKKVMLWMTANRYKLND